MEIDFLEDPSCTDPSFPPEMHPLFIEERLLGLIYLADGKGPHKTLVLLHGFPGNEKNQDLAHTLRRAGFNVLVFHYAGSWGSRGDYSFGQAYRDLETVRRALEEESFALNHRIDRENIYLAGHSVGGFLTLLAARNGMDFQGFAVLAPYNLSAQAERIHSQEEGAYRETLDLFQGGMPPLNGTTPEILIEEILGKRGEWNFFADDSAYEGEKILLVVATLDEVAHPRIHQWPISEMIKRLPRPGNVVSLSCSHDFSEKRVTLAQTLCEWLRGS